MANFGLKSTVILLSCLLASALHAKTTKVKKVNSPAIQEINVDDLLDSLERNYQISMKSGLLVTLLEAEMQYNQGGIHAAIQSYINAFNATQDPKVALRAMQMALNDGDLSSVAAIYEHWLSKNPAPSPELSKVKWGIELLINHNEEYALAHVDEVFQSASPSERAFLFDAFLHTDALFLYTNQPELPTELIQKLLQFSQIQRPLAHDLLVQSALFALQDEKKKSIAALEKLAQSNPKFTRETNSLLSFLNQKDYLDKLDSISIPNEWKNMILVKWIFYSQTDKMQAALPALLKNNPTADIYTSAALLSNMQDDFDGATCNLKKAYELAPRNKKSKVALSLAQEYAAHKKNAESQYWLDQVTDSEHQLDRVILELDILLENKASPETLVSKLAQLPKLPANEPSRYNVNIPAMKVISAYSRVPYNAAIIAEFTRYFDDFIHSKNASKGVISSFYELRSIMYTDIKQDRLALQDLKKVLQFDPDNDFALNNLGYTMLLQPKANYRQALQYIQKAIELHEQTGYPPSASYLDSLGWAYFKLKQYTKAIDSLQNAYAAAQAYPLDDLQRDQQVRAEILAHLSAAYFANKQTIEGKDFWQQAYELDPNNGTVQQLLKQYRLQPRQ